MIMAAELKTEKDSTNMFHQPGAKRQILVVDDEMINREVLGHILAPSYDVLYAKNGKEAMMLIRENRETLSLVFLDLIMPDMSGKEVLALVTSDEELFHIPVIVLTSDQESEVECFGLGAIDFIPKPYPQADVILARVRRTIELFEGRNIIRSTERDKMTGLYSKEYFFRYSELFDNQNRNDAADAIVVDINHFRILNERYGKTFCDGILVRIAKKIESFVLDSGGIGGRRESDTFLIYCPHREDYVKMLNSFSVELGDEAGAGRVHVRMGVYANVDKSVDMERRFDRAKMAADTVQGSFTKTIGFYDEKLNEQELFAEQLIEDFSGALEEKQFEVYYQPKFNIRHHIPVLSSAEALVRWNHPKLMVSPGLFIPLFESNGLIHQLDIFVWQTTARQIRRWKDHFGYAVPVSVNVSRVDLYDENVVGTLIDIVESNGLSPEDMHLEVTESAYTENSGQIIDMVNKLRDYGFRIEMDDFGTGYSSLNMISKLPIDALKLDMGFIRDAFKQGGSTRMLEVILDIAAYLGVPTIAEGVETEEQYKALRLMGCNLVQGYYFSQPVPASKFEPFLVQLKKTEAEINAFRKAEKEKEEAKHSEKLTAMRRSEEEKTAGAEVGFSETRKKSNLGGIPMRTFNIFLAVLSILIAVILFLSDVNVNRGYRQSVTASSRYTNAQQAAFTMETVSDYLTYRVRSFVVNGDARYMNEYFEEIDVSKRRERALSKVEELLDGSQNNAYASLAEALKYSNELAERELLSMRLWLESAGYSQSEIPEQLKSISLGDTDLKLTPEEQRNKAVMLVFDDVYMDYKDKIKANVGICMEELLTKSKQDLDDASSHMIFILRLQSVLITVFLLAILAVIFFERTQIQKPLADLVIGMRAQKSVKPAGAEELRFVTETYNEFLENSQKARAQLTYEAAHDPLTGLFNRTGYDLLFRSVDQEHIAVLLVCVDQMDKIRDIYGKSVSDEVLKRVASVLRADFRSVDVIARIDDAEFSVILTRVNSSMHQLVRNKLIQINKMLHDPQGEIPGISVSAGAAFSDRDNAHEDIMTDARIALDRAKAGGRKNCEIY